MATNLTAGALSGYLLVWMVVAASLVAILIQYQAAKLGVATGRSLPELCRARFPRWGSRLLWLQAEVVVLATDLAEFVGAAIGGPFKSQSTSIDVTLSKIRGDGNLELTVQSRRSGRDPIDQLCVEVDRGPAAAR